MMKPEISAREKALLQDIPAFNRSELARGWQVRSHRLGVSDLSGICLARAVMDDVEIAETQLTGSQIRQTAFNNMAFDQVDLSAAHLEEVTFTDCSFAFGTLAGARLVRCAFRRCQMHNASLERAIFVECTFEDLADEASRFNSSELQDCRFIRCVMRNTSFFATTLRGVQWQEGQIDSLSLSRIQGRRLAFNSVAVRHLSLDASEFSGLGFRQCNVQGASWTGCRLSDIDLRECELLSGLSAIKTTCTHLSLEDCPLVCELCLHDSQIQDMAVRKSRLYHLNLELSVLSGQNVWVDSEIHGANLSSLDCKGLEINAVQFGEYLVLRRASFEGTKIRRAKYLKGIELSGAETVTYINADPFQP